MTKESRGYKTALIFLWPSSRADKQILAESMAYDLKHEGYQVSMITYLGCSRKAQIEALMDVKVYEMPEYALERILFEEDEVMKHGESEHKQILNRDYANELINEYQEFVDTLADM